jgi:multiple sugar transport system permease protein
LAIFLPVVTPDVAGYVVWRWLFDRSFGAINAALKMLGLPAFGGLSSVDTAMLSILIAELWHHAGFYMIIFLANLWRCATGRWRRLPHIDGASTWQRWWYVILPQLRARARHQHRLRTDPVPQDLHRRRGDDQGRPE